MNTEPKQYRRSVWIPPLLWSKVVKQAGRETMRTGEHITPSEIVRRALDSYLGKQKP
jgi:hypothetical protein